MSDVCLRCKHKDKTVAESPCNRCYNGVNFEDGNAREPQPVKTLLDEFAKEAMGKLIEISSGTTMPREELGYVYNFISEQAWGFAAAMMKERGRRDEMGNVKEVK